MGKNLLNRSSRKKGKTRSPECSESQLVQNVEELKDVFKRFDANGDGKISSSELGGIMRSMGCRASEEEVGVMMKEADSDGDGFISLQEFIDLNTKGNDKAGCLRDLKNAFGVFDLDRNGSISAKELYEVLKGMGEGSSMSDCHNMIKSVDANGDGLVNFEEFKTMMTNSSSK